jgi:hypothetical protein
MRWEGGLMSFAPRKPEEAPSLSKQQQQQQRRIRVGRDAVEKCSRLTSETLDQISDEILNEVLKQLEKKQK